MNWHWVYICPLPLESPSHLPPHPTLRGCHRALALGSLHHTLGASLIAQLVNNLPAMLETSVRLLSQEDPYQILNFHCLSILHIVMLAQMVKDLPAMQETQVLTLDGEDPLEKGMSICFKSTVLTAISVQLLSLV